MDGASPIVKFVLIMQCFCLENTKHLFKTKCKFYCIWKL